MPEKLSNSAKVTYLNNNRIINQLKKAVRALKENPNVEKVYLFGSFVRGDYIPGSDLDICIILNNTDIPRIIDRIPYFLDYFMNLEMPVDVFPYTIKEVEKMKKSNHALINEILKNGVEI